MNRLRWILLAAGAAGTMAAASAAAATVYALTLAPQASAPSRALSPIFQAQTLANPASPNPPASPKPGMHNCPHMGSGSGSSSSSGT